MNFIDSPPPQTPQTVDSEETYRRKLSRKPEVRQLRSSLRQNASQGVPAISGTPQIVGFCGGQSAIPHMLTGYIPNFNHLKPDFPR